MRAKPHKKINNMKYTLFILLMILSLGSAAQHYEYVITGYKFNNEDFTPLIANTNSLIKVHEGDRNSTLEIFNKGEHIDMIGFISEDKENPDQSVAKDATHNESKLFFRKFYYSSEHSGSSSIHIETHPMSLGDVSIVLVFKGTSTIINCTVLTKNGNTINYSGYQTKQY